MAVKMAPLSLIPCSSFTKHSKVMILESIYSRTCLYRILSDTLNYFSIEIICYTHLPHSTTCSWNDSCKSPIECVLDLNILVYLTVVYH